MLQNSIEKLKYRKIALIRVNALNFLLATLGTYSELEKLKKKVSKKCFFFLEEIWLVSDMHRHFANTFYFGLSLYRNNIEIVSWELNKKTPFICTTAIYMYIDINVCVCFINKTHAREWNTIFVGVSYVYYNVIHIFIVIQGLKMLNSLK